MQPPPRPAPRAVPARCSAQTPEAPVRGWGGEDRPDARSRYCLSAWLLTGGRRSPGMLSTRATGLPIPTARRMTAAWSCSPSAIKRCSLLGPSSPAQPRPSTARSSTTTVARESGTARAPGRRRPALAENLSIDAAADAVLSEQRAHTPLRLSASSKSQARPMPGRASGPHPPTKGSGSAPAV